MIRMSFTSFHPSQLLQISAGRGGTADAPYALMIIALGTVLMVGIGILKERGMHIREKIARLPLPAAAAVWLILLLSIGFLGSTAAPRGFIYAQF